MTYLDPRVLYSLLEVEDENRERSIAHHPSSLCAVKDGVFIGKCRRAVWYGLMQVPPTNKPDGVALLKMRIGDMIHSQLGEAIGRALQSFYPDEYQLEERYGGSQLGTELEVEWKEKNLGLPLRGRLDKVLMFQDSVIGIDWKSTYGRGVDDVMRSGPKLEAVLQVLAYLRQKKIKIDYYLLVYIARDSGYIYPFVFQPQRGGSVLVTWLAGKAHSVLDWRWAHVEAGLRPLEEAYARKKVPARDYAPVFSVTGEIGAKSPWQCRYCSYWRRCAKDGGR